MSSDETMGLGNEFPQAQEDEWRSLAEKALRGASFKETLFSQTDDGIEVKPLYTGSDFQPGHGDYPGVAPYVRGFGRSASSECLWDVRQTFRHPVPKEANAEILRDLAGGVGSIELRFDQALRNGIAVDDSEFDQHVGVQGVAIHCLQDLDQVLEAVFLDMIELSLDAGMGFHSAASAMMVLWEQRGHAKDEVAGAFNADPIGAAADGAFFTNMDDVLDELAELAGHSAGEYPHVTSINVDTRRYHNAGANNVYEVALALATGVTYLKVMISNGMSIEDAVKQMRFSIAVDADIFASAAKIRALRMAWYRVAQSFGCDKPSTKIQAVTSNRMLTKFDPWVNILRGTTAGFAAVLGGADTITIEPFDSVSGVSSQQARRIARNTQTVLSEESMLSKVIDPAGGSWYVESLTRQLAQMAWSEFQDVEISGGVMSILKSGQITKKISSLNEVRAEKIATRVQASIGTTEFPNLTEDKLEPSSVDTSGLRESIAAKVEKSGGGGTVDLDNVDRSKYIQDGSLLMGLQRIGTVRVQDPLISVRDSEPFECLRDKSETILEKTGARPSIFLANWGHPSDFTARMTFAKNLFEAGGIEANPNDGFKTIASLVDAYKSSGAQMAVLCSTNEVYSENGRDIIVALKALGPIRIYVAGKPNESDALREAGADGFIASGMNILRLLEDAHNALGLAD